MPPRPKVPFALHPSLRLRANLDAPDVSRALLTPDGGLALVSRPGSGTGGSIDLRPRPDAPAARALPAPERGWWDSVEVSRDGSRWAAMGERWDGDTRRGRLIVGERGREDLVLDLETPRGAPITINHQTQSAPLIALSPDGSRAVVRASVGERHALVGVDIARGVAETHLLPKTQEDLFAHTWGGDGALYTVASYLGARGGLARWRPDGTVERRWDWAAGCTLCPAPDGVWALGLGGVVWRIGGDHPGRFVPAKAQRLARAQDLRARATHRWDVAFLDHLVKYIDTDQRAFTWETNTPKARWGPLPEAMPGARGFDTEFLWECAFAVPVGTDAVLVSDGLSVALLRDRGDVLDRTTVLEDLERCSPRTRRIVGLTASGGTVAVLWKKSASSTQLSLFDLDSAAV
jgi:hypothetical protein